MNVKTLCLGVLSLGDASGYEIRKMFEEGPFAHFHQASYGSIYPALAELLKSGDVTCTVQAQDGRPDKKIYAISAAGLAAFRTALRKNPEMDRVRSETLFMMFFADQMEDDHLANVFDAYAELHRTFVDKIKSLDNEGLSRGRRFVRGYGLAFYEGVLKYMDDNREAFLSAPKGEGWRDMEALRECLEKQTEEDQ